MRRWVGPALALFGAAGLAHGLTLGLGPGVIMDRAMVALEARGVAVHAFTTPQRVTPQSQQVVRSSPDLYYALCRYDLSEPGSRLVVGMGDWPDYQSLSFFDARTDNFATLRGTDKAVSTGLLPPGSPSENGAIVSPSVKGVILIRRLAPDAESFAAAVEAGKADACRLERTSR